MIHHLRGTSLAFAENVFIRVKGHGNYECAPEVSTASWTNSSKRRAGALCARDFLMWRGFVPCFFFSFGAAQRPLPHWLISAGPFRAHFFQNRLDRGIRF